MINVIVKFFASLMEIAEEDEVEISLPNKSSVIDLLEKISCNYGADFKNYLFDAETGKVRPYLQIVVDGKYTSSSEGYAIELKDRSRVVILPPLSGG